MLWRCCVAKKELRKQETSLLEVQLRYIYHGYVFTTPINGGGGLYKKRFKVSKDHGQLTPKVQAQHLCFSFQKSIFI